MSERDSVVVGIVGKSKNFDFSIMLIFWSFVTLVRNSVMLAVYLLFSVACFFTVHEHSDWATTDIDASVKSMWYRLSRRESDYLSAVQMAPHSSRCGYAICGKETKKFLLAFMPAVRKEVLFRQNLRICRLQNVCGKLINNMGVHV